MSDNMENPKVVFKYNMSFYYKSTIIYIIALVLYIVIRGEFVENSFKLITKDPLLYFIAIIVIISMLSLLYNLFRNKHIKIVDDGISFIDRFKTRSFKIEQIKYIKFTRQRRTVNTKEFKNVKIKVITRIRPFLVRLSDYENQDELLKRFEELKSLTENKSVQ